MQRKFHDTTMKSICPQSVFGRRMLKSLLRRHTFINCLYSKNVDENVLKTLVGHEEEFTMKHYGGEPFSPESCQEISKVSTTRNQLEQTEVFKKNFADTPIGK